MHCACFSGCSPRACSRHPRGIFMAILRRRTFFDHMAWQKDTPQSSSYFQYLDLAILSTAGQGDLVNLCCLQWQSQCKSSLFCWTVFCIPRASTYFSSYDCFHLRLFIGRWLLGLMALWADKQVSGLGQSLASVKAWLAWFSDPAKTRGIGKVQSWGMVEGVMGLHDIGMHNWQNW